MVPTAHLFDAALSNHRSGRLTEAETLYRRVLEADAQHSDALHMLGVVAHQLGRHDDAVGLIDKAIAINGSYPIYHANRGAVLKALGRFDEGLACYDAALRLQPDMAGVFSNRGILLRALGRMEEAVASYDAALRISPDFADAHSNRAIALLDLGRLEDALAACDAAIAINPGYAEAHSNRGNALRALGRLEEAVASYDTALRINPAYAEAHSNRGCALHELNRLDEALAAYGAALRIKPDYADAHHNLGQALLAAGHFGAGWREYEWRWQAEQMGGDVQGRPRPRWHGEDGSGRSLLIQAEQGIGDSLQFCRYVPIVAARGWRVVLQVPGTLSRLMCGLHGVSRVVTESAPPTEFDACCPMLSLPLATGMLEPWSPPEPYLRPDPRQQTAWKQRLEDFPAGLRIGLAWAGNRRFGNATNHADKRRSINPDILAPLLGIPGITWFSLQKDGPVPPFADRMVDVMAEMNDFADTAALAANLDLVISVDTAVAHLAAALGRPVWLLDRYDACWRWLRGRSDSPWYPSLRIFRQNAAGDWAGVVQRVRLALRDLSS